MFLMESFLNSSIESEIYTERYSKKIVLNIWVPFSLAILSMISFSLEELNTANISFYEMNVL